MRACKLCRRKFPEVLLAPMNLTQDGELRSLNPICPICALQKRNEISGLPKNAPFSGEHAQFMLEEARKYLKSRTRRKGWQKKASLKK
jgi:hypothetical protein